MKVLLATNIKAMDDGVKGLAGDGIEFAGEVYYREAVAGAAGDADIVVVSAALPGDASIEDIIYRLRCMDKRVVLLAGGGGYETVGFALEAGVYDILTDPVRPEDVVALIRNPRRFSDVAEMVMDNARRKGNTGMPVIAESEKKPGNPGSIRRAVTVAGAKGAGKSFVVSNIAYTFAGRGITTSVLDGDIKERAQWYYFNIPDEEKRYALKEILEAGESEGAVLMGGRLKVYTTAMYDMRFNKVEIRPEYGRLTAVMDKLRLEAGMVIADNDGDLDNSFTQLSMSMADTVLLVVRPCYDELQNVRWMLGQLGGDRLTLGKFILVINGYVNNRGFTAGDIARYLNGKFAGRVVIPADNAAAYESLRFGKPAVSIEGCSEEMKEAFEVLAGLIAGTA